jgi:hypothetical protein
MIIYFLIKYWKKNGQGPTKGCRAVDKIVHNIKTTSTSLLGLSEQQEGDFGRGETFYWNEADYIKEINSIADASDFYSGDFRFESRSGNRLPWP